MKTLFITDLYDIYEVKIIKETEKMVIVENNKTYKTNFKKNEIWTEIFETKEDCKKDAIKYFESKIDFYLSETKRFNDLIKKFYIK